MLPGFWSVPSWSDAPILATFGIIGGAGHYILILAFTATQASVLAPFSYIGLLFSAIWGYLVFREVPDSWTIAGAAIIVGAGLYVWYREAKTARPEDPT